MGFYIKNSDRYIDLVLPYYDCGNESRQDEIHKSIKSNLENKIIRSITLIVDDGSDPRWIDENLRILNIDSRPTYLDWTNISKEFPKSGISILANSDIYFDESLSLLKAFMKIDRTFVALSRWDIRQGVAVPHPNPHWSQDVWAFSCAERFDPVLTRGLDIPIGVPRCDNKIAYQFAVNGWRIVNPHRHVKAYHLHETEFRAYQKKRDDRILGGVAYVSPVSDYDESSTIEVDIWAKNANRIRKVSLNRSLDNWEAQARSGETETPREDAVPLENRDVGDANPTGDGAAAGRVGELLASGDRLYNHLRRFMVLQKGEHMLYWDALYPSPGHGTLVPASVLPQDATLEAEHLAHWIKPVISTWPLTIAERPRDAQDVHFWQYPAATERQAFDNHVAISQGANFDRSEKLVHTYLPLPWATFIDKKTVPVETRNLFRVRASGLRSLAAANGYRLRVHTVCQHIHWRRLLPTFREFGVTDLHVSHYEKCHEAEVREFGMEPHGWPLIAVNVENAALSEGLVFGKPVEQRRFLASFIGAHMPHYRSDVRLKLLEAARADGGNDILVEVNDEWHFNKLVYDEQVKSKQLAADDVDVHRLRTRRYNDILSDSIFALCPEGAGPNTLRIWEAMAVGSIPVIIGNCWRVPTAREGVADNEFVLYRHPNEISTLFERLRSLDNTDIERMKIRGMEIYDAYRSMICFPACSL